MAEIPVGGAAILAYDRPHHCHSDMPVDALCRNRRVVCALPATIERHHAMTAASNFSNHTSRRTKIVATLGPASSSKEMIAALFDAGVDTFRMNFSHGSHEDHAARLKLIREIEAERGRPIGVFADLQGPKLRLGTFENGGIDVEKGHVIRLDLDEAPGGAERVYLPHPDVIAALALNGTVLVDDGKVRLKIVDKGEGFVVAEVIAGKRLMDRKGFNLPDTMLTGDALTPKDRKDLVAALDMGVEWIAQSFVQRAADLVETRKLIGGRAKLITKLEKPSALEDLDAIIENSDAVMLARGDLGVELPAEQVPTIQKRVVRRVREMGKPVIVATQMLESMITSPTPTRAEASDVATAIYDGADAVMLSAETAAGDYPLEAVSMMVRIAANVEKDTLYRKIMHAEPPATDASSSDAITVAAYQVAETIGAAAIVNYTTSGSTTLRTARVRPSMPIICLTENLDVARRMALSYGVYAIHTEDIDNFQDMIDKATDMASKHCLATKGCKVVVTAGVPFGTVGSTNILRIADVA